MEQNGMYFGKNEFYQLIRDIGGEWNDAKERPLVCLIKSIENDKIYWAIPIGNWEHRDETAKQRILRYISYEVNDIRSCYYHIGNTDVSSIFFISDTVPIIEKYIDREYVGKYTGNIYVIKNNRLKEILELKLKRILSWENNRPNSFRQHITDIKNFLIEELKKETNC